MVAFCFSFSSGKDSVLALDQLIQAGHQPLGLVTSLNASIERSWFHGVPPSVLQSMATSLNLPLTLVETSATNYQSAMIDALQTYQQCGATHCGFGDIDLLQNRQWDTTVAKAAQLQPLLPLWQADRAANVTHFRDRGYQAIIKTVSKAAAIPTTFLGQPLDQTFIDYLVAHHLDVCGENGEYHTLVIDGPLFKQPVSYQTAGIFESDYAYSLIIN